jgi:hypothetical protein
MGDRVGTLRKGWVRMRGTKETSTGVDARTTTKVGSVTKSRAKAGVTFEGRSAKGVNVKTIKKARTTSGGIVGTTVGVVAASSIIRTTVGIEVGTGTKAGTITGVRKIT